MSQAWKGPYAEIRLASAPGTVKSIVDNGRPVYVIPLLSSEGNWIAGNFGSGSATAPLDNRDNYPFVEKGDIMRTYCYSERVSPSTYTAVVAMFIVQEIAIDEVGGTVEYSGEGLSEELQRKILDKDFIAISYSGTAPIVNETYVQLAAADVKADDFYNGAVIEVDGKFADVDDYTNSSNRCNVTWRDGFIDSTNRPYNLYLGKAPDDITQAISNSQTWWTSSISGSPNGTFIPVNGRYCIDLLKDIVTESGWYFREQLSTTVERKLYWFDSNAATPIDSGVYVAAMSEFTAAGLESNTNNAPVINCTRSRSWRDKWTRIYVASNDGITLNGLTGADVTVPTGFSVDYANSLVIHDDAEAGLIQPQITEASFVFKEISATNTSSVQRKETQQRVFYAAIAKLRARSRLNSTYNLRTVLLRDIQVGETLHLKYTKSQNGEILWTVDDDLWIRNIKPSADSSTGLRILDIELGEQFVSGPKDGNEAVAQAIANSGAASNIIVSGGTGTAPGTHYHTQYFPLDASAIITGLTRIANGLQFQAAQTISTTAGNLTLQPAADLLLYPTSTFIKIDGTLQFQGPEKISTTTGDLTIQPQGDLILTPNNTFIKIDGTLQFQGPEKITTTTGDLTIQPQDDLVLSPNSTFVKIDGTLQFQGPEKITTTTGDLTIQPTNNLVLTPNNSVVELTQFIVFRGEGYVAPGATAFTQQFKIDTDAGAIYCAYIEADEMHVRLFQADITMAKANGLVVTDSVAVVAQVHTVAPIDSSSYLYVEDNPVFGDAQVFNEGDWIRERAFRRSTGVNMFNVWSQVSNYVDQTDGTQRWDATTRKAGSSDQAVGYDIGVGTPVLGYGKSGQGWWEVDARREQGPFVRFGAWYGDAPWKSANQVTHILEGNLVSLTGTQEYGFFTGDINGPHVLLSDIDNTFQDIEIHLTEGLNDNAYIRLYALRLVSDLDLDVRVNGDISASGITRSSGSGSYYTHIEEDPTWMQPDSDWINNDVGQSGTIKFNLQPITHNMTRMSIKFYVSNHAFVNDTCQLFAQLFKSDQTTKLSDKIKLSTQNSLANGTDALFEAHFTSLDISASDAEWDAAIIQIWWVYQIRGTSPVLDLDATTGLTIHTESYPPNNGYHRIVFNNSTTDRVLGQINCFETTATSADFGLYMYEGYDNPTHNTMTLQVEAQTNYDADLELAAYGNSGNDSPAIVHLYSNNAYPEIGMQGIIYASDGMNLGGSNTPSRGQIVLDQGSGDGYILTGLSSDLTALTTQGMDTNETFIQISKISGLNGGVLIKGGAEGSADRALQLVGSANTPTAVRTTAGFAPLVLIGQIDGTSVGADNNAVALYSGPYMRWVMQGDGDTYQDGDMYDTQDFTPDFLDDVSAIRATMIATGKAIISKIKPDVDYTKEYLEELELLNGKHRNRSKLSELHSGAIWQLHERLVNIEQKKSLFERICTMFSRRK